MNRDPDSMHSENFALPKAIRQFKFSEDEFLEGSIYGFNLTILNDEVQKETKKLYLTERDDAPIYQITDEYPIVRYFSKDTNELNCFVKSITASIVSGSNFEYDEEVRIDKECLVYIKKPYGVLLVNRSESFTRMILKKPKLIVTKEGALIFYTSNEMFTTMDGISITIICIAEFDEGIKNDKIVSIKAIEADERGTIIQLKTEKGKNVSYEISICMNLLENDFKAIEFKKVVDNSESQD